MNVIPHKFAIGQPVSRTEDPLLLRGEGRYSDDVALAGQLHAVVVRSTYANGLIRSLDTEAARAAPGVAAVITAADLADYKDLPGATAAKHRDGSDPVIPPHPALAREHVRYVGEPYAVVIAQTRKQAQDAAELVMADIDALPAVTSEDAALAEGAVAVHDAVPGNVALDYHFGDTDAVQKQIDAAAHVTRLTLVSQRIVVCSLEPRAATAEFDASSGRYVLHVCSQGVFGMRNAIAGVLGIAPDKLRILTNHVGGSFGMKAGVFPEYIAILHAARVLGRPVHWADERSGSFMSDTHGRDHTVSAELALDKDARILALRCTGTANIGAYLGAVNTMMPTLNLVKNVVSVYRTPVLEASMRVVFTHTTPIGAYRGAGRPEGNYYMERLMDTAAAELGIDPIEIRRRNLIQSAEMPFTAASGQVYDSGDFPAILEEALAVADWDNFPARRAESRRRGKLRGRGIGQYLEVTAPSGHEMGGIRFEADGTVTIVTGTLDYGQGHASPFAQILSDRLGIPFETIRLVQGDSDQLIVGGGTGGSRSAMASGNAIVVASRMVIEKGKALAAQALEAAEADIEFEAGRFHIAGTDRGIGLLDLAARLREGMVVPPGVEASLDVSHDYTTPPSAFPNGCHIAEVEIDPDTGEIEVVSYMMVNDFGTIINPLLVEGQAHGGVVQGLGQALYEGVHYDESGQLLTGSFMDYALPHATQTPSMTFASHPVPARTNELGVKGCGEAGCAGSLPAVMNAVIDALRPYGVEHLDMPATPLRVWQALQQAAPALAAE